MSGGGGGSGNDGGNDMQVSGAEAAYSNEKGISTNAESKTGYTGGNNYSGQDNEEQQAIDTYNSTPDTSTVGIAAPDTNYSTSEIEKGYTDNGVKLSQVGAGKYMTKE